MSRLEARIPGRCAGWRLDRALAEVFGQYSRARLQRWLRQGRVCVDGDCQPPARRVVHGGEHVVLRPEEEAATAWQAQALPLDILYDDAHLLVVNKPPGVVVHPGAGQPDGTLANALLHYAPELEAVPRAGVVHRLDKDTSGLLVVARSLTAQHRLVAALQARQVRREYEAVVNGVVVAGGTVDAPIGRHPTQRTRMAVVPGGRPAVTHYRVLERYRAHSRLRVFLETGRTHQIRVHMAHIRHPLVGDRLYGGRPVLPKGCAPRLAELLRRFPRQALHARRLALRHPVTGRPMEWEAPLPEDMAELLAALREDAAGG